MLEGLATFLAKLAAVHWISVISASAIVAAMASLVRIVFSPNRGFWHGMGTFFGGVLVGTLIGYIVSDIPSVHDYNNAIVAAASIGAREFVEWILERFRELQYMRLAYLLSDEKFKHFQTRVDAQDDSVLHSRFHDDESPTTTETADGPNNSTN